MRRKGKKRYTQQYDRFSYKDDMLRFEGHFLNMVKCLKQMWLYVIDWMAHAGKCMELLM